MPTIQIADKPTLDNTYDKLSHKGHCVGVEKSLTTYKIPYEFYGGCAVVLNDEIHILGGSNGNVDIFAPYSHCKWDGVKWTNVSTLPYEFINGSAVVLDGEIHIMGANTSTYMKYHYKWDGSQWISVSTLPINFVNCAAVVYDGKIHLLGSNNSSTYYKYNYSFDSETSTWTKLTNMPVNFYKGCAVVYDDCLYILGGGGSTTAFRKWDGSAWSTVTVGDSTTAIVLPYAFSDGSAVVYDGKIHIFGSGNAAAVYYNHYSWDGTAWTQHDNVPYICFHSCATVYRGEIYLLGGGNASNASSMKLMYRLDKNNGNWIDYNKNNDIVSELPYNFYNGGAVVYNGAIHIMGGKSSTSIGLKHHYKWDGLTWKNESNLHYDLYQE